MKKSFLRFAILSLSLCAAAAGVHAQSVKSAGSIIGLGQDSAQDPAKIRNLRLSDPLVRQKYLNEPDMLRFLRATYSEACARGAILTAAKQVASDPKRNNPPKAVEAANRLIESGRIWKMNSFEMEALIGDGYLRAANRCDCLMKEVADQDLVDPRKGLDVIDKLSKDTLKMCATMADDLTKAQLEKRKKLEEASKKSGKS